MDKKRDSFFLPDKKQKNTKPVKVNKEKKKETNKRQEQFDKNRNGIDKEEQEKKPFDKKTYRLKKYSKKYKLEQWEEQRKKRLLRDYYKDVKNDEVSGSYKPIQFDNDTTDSSSYQPGKFVRHPDLIEKEQSHPQTQFKNKIDPFQRAKDQYEKLKQDKVNKRQQIEKQKEEKLQKMQEYKKKKQERFKKLSKKTKKGQPMMTGRLELLLEKIQASK